MLRAAAVLLAQLRRPRAAQAQGLPSSRSRSPRRRSSALEADVRVAGVNVGKVRAKTLDPRHRNRTVATIEVDSGYAPIAEGRPRDPAPEDAARRDVRRAHAGPCARRGHDPRRRDARRLAGEGDRPARRDLRCARPADAGRVPGLAAGGGARRSAATARTSTTRSGRCPRFADDGTDLLRVLDGQKQQTQALIRNTGVVFGALTQDERKLHDLIVTAGQTFDATSRRQQALADTFQIFPTFLDESKLTFARLETFSKATDPLVQDLRPGAAATRSRRSRDVHALAPDLRRTFTNLDPLITASRTGLPATTQTLDGDPADARRAAAVPRGAQPRAPVPRVPPARHRGLHLQRRGDARRHRADGDPERGRPLPAPVRPDRPGDRRDVREPPVGEPRQRVPQPRRAVGPGARAGDDLPELRLRQRGRPAHDGGAGHRRRAVLLRAAAAGVAARQHAEVPAHRPGRLREVGALPMRTPG